MDKATKIKIKDNWGDITLNEFIELELILNSDIPDSYRTTNILSLLSNRSTEELENLPAVEFVNLANKLNFITEAPKPNKVKNKYKINNNTYILKADISNITTAQYMDYQAYNKEIPLDLAKIIACWIIPSGHEYNDGYDMQEVFKDAGDMPLIDALGISFFFPKQLAAYILILKDSLEKNLTELEMDKKKVEELAAHLNSTAYYLWCYPYAEKPSHLLIK